jgi:acid phosphatase family membrane protein YuiD
MIDIIRNSPFLVAAVAALTAQTVKVLTFLLLEKKVNFRRLLETDGTPNMHSAAFMALTLNVGLREGFDTLVFALSLCVTAIVSVDIWNVKRAASRHAELIILILDRMSRSPADYERSRKALSYTPVDVLSGAVLGCVVTLLLAH